MKIAFKYLVVGCFLATVIGSISLLKVSAQSEPMTDTQIELIRSTCGSTKNTLNQLHVSDALLRVNMGQVYESLASKLMDRFNGRVSSNGFSVIDLISATTSYRLMLDVFRADYKAYEEQLSTTLNIDCTKQPSDFYDAISWARIKRSQVNTDVKKLDEYIAQYQSSVAQFEKDFQAKTASEVKK